MRATRDVGERGWVWLLRAVGALLVVVAVANVVDLVGTLLRSDERAVAPAARVSRQAVVVDVAGVYHFECSESPTTMAAHVKQAVRYMLPSRLVASEGELPLCRRCGERIQRGSQIWLVPGD